MYININTHIYIYTYTCQSRYEFRLFFNTIEKVLSNIHCTCICACMCVYTYVDRDVCKTESESAFEGETVKKMS